MNGLLIYVGSGLLVFWGVFHMIPTRNVIKGFGVISTDNRRILAMEWINEGATLIFLGVLAAIVAALGNESTLSRAVLVCVAVMLNALSGISLATGARVSFLPYRLCPVIFSGASILILLGTFL